MNYFLIAGIIFGILAAMSTGYGTYVQQKREEKQQEKMQIYVEKQDEKERPILTVLGAKLTGQNREKAELAINNSGELPPEEASLVFTFHPHDVLARSTMALPAVPRGATVPFIIALWNSQLTKVLPPITSPGWERFLEEYKKGEKPFMTTFHLEYKYKDQLFKTENYTILLTSNGLVASFIPMP